MKKALISMVEQVYNGYRVAQVEDAANIFPVHDNLIWADCDDTIVADKFYYDSNTKTFIVIPDLKANTANTSTATTV